MSLQVNTSVSLPGRHPRLTCSPSLSCPQITPCKVGAAVQAARRDQESQAHGSQALLYSQIHCGNTQPLTQQSQPPRWHSAGAMSLYRGMWFWLVQPPAYHTKLCWSHPPSVTLKSTLFLPEVSDSHDLLHTSGKQF